MREFQAGGVPEGSEYVGRFKVFVGVGEVGEAAVWPAHSHGGQRGVVAGQLCGKVVVMESREHFLLRDFADNDPESGKDQRGGNPERGLAVR